MIHVVARSPQHGEAFLGRHPSLAPLIHIRLGCRSYFELLNDLIANTGQPYACVVHDDVLLCADFGQRLQALVDELNRDWPNWGLAGNAAVSPLHVGYSVNNVVRYISDPHFGPNLSGHVLPAQSIDGNVMLLNLAAMRARGVRLPAWDGFHLYDIVTSIETIAAGLGVVVAPQLACWHGSKGNQAEFDRAKDAGTFNDYLLHRVRNRKVTTLNGQVSVRLDHQKPFDRGPVDMELDSLRSATRGRPAKTVAIVTRTQFGRPALLDRALETIGAFMAASGSDRVRYASYVVTDTATPAPETVARHAATVLRADLPTGCDTRYLLVRFAAQNIEADYFWFVDDDDWLLPNEAERLSLALNAAPAESIVFVDSQHFHERPVQSDSGDGALSYRSTEGKYFPARRFLASLSGHNHSPFCGVLFPRSALLAIQPAVYESVTYYEDFMTILTALLSGNYLPVVVDKLMVGISLRESGNTVTETDRSKWNQSMSELVAHLVASKSGSAQMLSLHSQLSSMHSLAQAEAELASLRAQLAQIAQSSSWRITKPLRVAARLLRGQWTVSDVIRRLR